MTSKNDKPDPVSLLQLDGGGSWLRHGTGELENLLKLMDRTGQHYRLGCRDVLKRLHADANRRDKLAQGLRAARVELGDAAQLRVVADEFRRLLARANRYGTHFSCDPVVAYLDAATRPALAEPETAHVAPHVLRAEHQGADWVGECSCGWSVADSSGLKVRNAHKAHRATVGGDAAVSGLVP